MPSGREKEMYAGNVRIVVHPMIEAKGKDADKVRQPCVTRGTQQVLCMLGGGGGGVTCAGKGRCASWCSYHRGQGQARRHNVAAVNLHM
jgi:hypothetical protein